MNIENAIASLQLIGTSIKKISLENTFIVFLNSETVKKSIDLKYSIGNITKEDDDFFGNVILNLTIEIKDYDELDDDEQSLTLELEIEGGFIYQGTEESDFKEMLEISGTASIYSIARSIVTTITSLTFDGDKIVLPMVNFINFHDELIQETE